MVVASGYLEDMFSNWIKLKSTYTCHQKRSNTKQVDRWIFVILFSRLYSIRISINFVFAFIIQNVFFFYSAELPLPDDKRNVLLPQSPYFTSRSEATEFADRR